MKRRVILSRMAALCALAAVPAAAQTAAQRASLQKLSDYMNSIGTAQTRFRQVNTDGSVSTGTLLIQRPGRMRFEYDPPDQDTLVVASGGTVAVFDGRGGSAPEQFPLRRTPLNLILARNVDLTRASEITGIGTHRGMTIVEARDREHPDYGSIRLYFETAPLRLAEWLILTETGEETRVILDPLTPRDALPSGTFNIGQIAASRG